jgi:hypothetical protein
MQCDQVVTIDSCCNPTQCPEPAAWHHAASGFSLCALHYGNAAKYAFDNEWNVAGKQVPFPEGWAAVEAAAAAASASPLTAVEEVRASGLVIGSGSLSSSGLVLER